jgi:thiamine biosynthesis lipoprotein
VPVRLAEAIERRLAAIVAEMSQWEPRSLLSQFNRAPAGSWSTLPEDFATVLGAALDIAERTQGAFDPTHGRSAALLGFGAIPVDRAPSAAELDGALAAAGWRRLEFDRASRRARQPGGLWLDLSGIAKGFAVDAVSALLAGMGIEDALVEIGGELVGRGLRPDGQPWWVDLEDPPGPALPPLRVGLHDMAVATSGDYVRGAHTIDPRTGRPLPAHVASVSVLHDTAMMADAWATALTVLGPERGADLAAREGLAARIVSRGEVGAVETVSPALQAMIED